MMKIRPRRIVAFLGVIVLVIGGYVGWQIYKGQQMANQYAADAQKQAQGSANGSGSANLQIPGTAGITQPASSTPASPSGASASQAPSSQAPQPNSSTPSSPSSIPASEAYKQLMSSTYQQTLQAMQNVKGNTLAFQGRKMSISSYKSSILQSQATFSSAEAFVRANPPTEEKLNPSYQEFLAGISLAKESMGVVLNGISSLSASSFYAAREMGKTAQQQVVNGYSHL